MAHNYRLLDIPDGQTPIVCFFKASSLISMFLKASDIVTVLSHLSVDDDQVQDALIDLKWICGEGCD